MAKDKAQSTTIPVPWGDNPVACINAVQAAIPCEIAAVAIWTTENPQVDELLASRGVNAAVLARWLRSGFAQDPMLQKAMQEGLAVATEDQAGGEARLVRAGHSLVLMYPETVRRDRWWWLLLGRQNQAFTEKEQRQAELLLQDWHVNFNQAPETDMGLLLIGHDNRLLLADLTMQQRLLEKPDALRELLDWLHPVVQQRFPNLPDGALRDVAVQIDREPFWVRFRRDRTLNAPKAERWYLEMRPLEEGELPTVGRVEDQRIALAIAYLHDTFHNSPSLAQIARAVHTSPFHFHRLFSKQVGISPKQYLQRKQLQVAKWMLRASPEPIGQIAVATGFASHGHFTSTFHRIIGVSPSEYRDKHRSTRG